MDETALLALGILVEEKIKELLGKDGHRMYEDQSDMAPKSSLGSRKSRGEDSESEADEEN